jgi:hypothetical protein
MRKLVTAEHYAVNWHLNELRRVRSARRIGTASEANCTKERRAIQKSLVEIRRARTP